MTDDDLMALMLRVDPMTKRIPPGVRAIVEAVEAAERERLLTELRTMHAQQKGRHNYYLYAAELLAGNL